MSWIYYVTYIILTFTLILYLALYLSVFVTTFTNATFHHEIIFFIRLGRSIFCLNSKIIFEKLQKNYRLDTIKIWQIIFIFSYRSHLLH